MLHASVSVIVVNMFIVVPELFFMCPCFSSGNQPAFILTLCASFLCVLEFCYNKVFISYKLHYESYHTVTLFIYVGPYPPPEQCSPDEMPIKEREVFR